MAEQHPFEKLKKTISINGKDYVYFDVKDLGNKYRKLMAFLTTALVVSLRWSILKHVLCSRSLDISLLKSTEVAQTHFLYLLLRLEMI